MKIISQLLLSSIFSLCLAADPEILDLTVEEQNFGIVSVVDTVIDGSDTLITIDWEGSITFNVSDTDTGDSMGVFIDIVIDNDTFRVDSVWGSTTVATGNNQKAWFTFRYTHRNWSGSVSAKLRLTVDDISDHPEKYIYTFEEFRHGKMDKIMHCSGPLWSKQEHIDYITGFSATKPFGIRAGISLPDSRVNIHQKLAEQRDFIFNLFPNELHVMTITYVIKENGVKVGLDSQVVAGDYDTSITWLAEFAREQKRPVFVRICSEFNGDWNAMHKAWYAKSFRHIVDMFRSITDNCIFMWNYMAIPADFPFMEWYPGDEYMDWWSIDIFGQNFSNADANENMHEFLDSAGNHNMPMFIPETCPSKLDMESMDTWSNWFIPWLEVVNSDNVVGFSYSNRDFTKHVGLEEWGDMRLEQSTLFKPLWQAELNKQQYLHQQE